MEKEATKKKRRTRTRGNKMTKRTRDGEKTRAANFRPPGFAGFTDVFCTICNFSQAEMSGTKHF